ncbi:MAG: histidine decarboxylase, pyruvoyl type, partial [archaeon]|nr:histidine decarboxylase, pyruvoyl type [archaeon]
MKKEIERALAESIIEVGKNQHILYKEIYVCSNLKRVPSGKFGAAFSAVPYVVLPKDAVPEGDVTKLRTYTLSGWLDRVEDKFVSCRCEVSTRGR